MLDKSISSLKSNAANVVSGQNPLYTVCMFVKDFPQFRDISTKSGCNIPETILKSFIKMADDALQYARWREKWRYAMGLYIAHYATMYFQTYSEMGLTPEQMSKKGRVTGLMTSTTFGDVSVSYDVGIMAEATRNWGAWNATVYGQMLITEARLIGMGGAFII